MPAAFLALTPWDRRTPLVDPFCGSGTILAEALMLAANIPAGYLRKRWGFELLPDFDRDLWRKVKTDADKQIRLVPAGLIRGSDNDRTAGESRPRQSEHLARRGPDPRDPGRLSGPGRA